MLENRETSMSVDASSATVSVQQPQSGLSTDALARRRMLLKSLGKGATVVTAVSVPMHSLAAIGTLSVTETGPGGKRCTISGTMSGVHSGETVTVVCAGKSPGYYHKIEHWPGYSSTNTDPTITVEGTSKSFTQNTSFNDLFGSGTTATLMSLMPSGGEHATANTEAHWIGALLNATPGSIGAANNFPYTAKEVLELYGDVTKRDAALAFFSGYMETL